MDKKSNRKVKILVLVDKFVFPANDGVSKAVSSISFLLGDNFSVSYFEITSSRFYLTKTSDYVILDIRQLGFFNIILTSPLNVSIFLIKNRHVFKFQHTISLLSDCYTYVQWKQILLSIRFKFWSIKYLLLTVLRLLNGFLKERRISKSVDLILLQTEKDVKVFQAIFKNSKVIAIPNLMEEAVSEDYSNNDRSKNSIAFVASFVGSYLYIANWFFKEVFSGVVRLNPDVKIHLLGKGANEFNSSLISKYPNLKQNIVVEEYYDDLSLFYKRMNLSVAPIFKGYGLINKVVESMRFGCVTIGDSTAFNGINDVKSGEHCYFAENATQFIEAISLNMIKSNTKMRKDAADLIDQTFSEQKYRAIIESKISQFQIQDL